VQGEEIMYLNAKKMGLGLTFQDVLSMSQARSSKCQAIARECQATAALTSLVASAPSSVPSDQPSGAPVPLMAPGSHIPYVRGISGKLRMDVILVQVHWGDQETELQKVALVDLVAKEAEVKVVMEVKIEMEVDRLEMLAETTEMEEEAIEMVLVITEMEEETLEVVVATTGMVVETTGMVVATTEMVVATTGMVVATTGMVVATTGMVVETTEMGEVQTDLEMHKTTELTTMEDSKRNHKEAMVVVVEVVQEMNYRCALMSALVSTLVCLAPVWLAVLRGVLAKSK